MAEKVNHPSYYGGENNPYEAIKVIEAWDLGFCLGNTIRYISRAGKKDPEKEFEDLQKAAWYLNHYIDQKFGPKTLDLNLSNKDVEELKKYLNDTPVMVLEDPRYYGFTIGDGERFEIT